MVRKIKAEQILQPRAEDLSGHAIASTQGISRNSVAEVLNAAANNSSSWDELKDLTDDKNLRNLLPRPQRPRKRVHPAGLAHRP